MPNREHEASGKPYRIGDSSSGSEAPIYRKLRDLASRFIKGERRGHTLEPTELVHEAYLNLARDSGGEWKSRTHFVAVAACAMRQVLVAYARKRALKKREGGRRRVPLRDTLALSEAPDLDVLSLEEALAKLEGHDERKARVVELRFFGGLTFAETGEALGISPKTAEKDWYTARAWLHRQLSRE